MLKTVSSITNAIGALNYKGTWDANANSPALASSVGTKGDYYVVGTAGSTNLNGITNWGIGDWAAFNGSVWQRVEGGANLNGVDLSVSGTSTLSGLTASTALALDASKNIVSVTNTGTGNNVLATAPTLVGNVTLSTGDLRMGTSGKGIDFSGAGTAAEILDDYEEGTWTPTASATVTAPTTPAAGVGRYTKVGRLVTVTAEILDINMSGSSGALKVTGFPFPNAGSLYYNAVGSCFFSFINTPAGTQNIVTYLANSSSEVLFLITADNASYDAVTDNATTQGRIYLTMSYHSA